MEIKPVDLGLLRSFSPLDGMKRENLHSLARKAQVRDLSIGRLLFKEGENDKRTYYLLKGTVELLHDGRPILTIKGGSSEARNPIGPSVPRRYSARVASDAVQFLSMDSDLLDMMLTWDQTGTYVVDELHHSDDDLPAADDWMTTLLQSKAFHRIPPANIQAIFMRMQRVDYKAGEVVLKQGDEGDYFYVIVAGTCLVTRETPLNKEGIKLAQLSMGDTFGEEALISDAKRNATVSMLTSGTLMRLAKEDFRTLLKEPMLDWIEYHRAVPALARGAKWIDVRLPSEFDHQRLEEAINVPLYFLRLKLKTLDRNTHYIVYCDTGRRSSAAAYILNERGFKASVLRGGLTAIQPQKRAVGE
jgi:CRP-like cAMP-binding protein